MSINRKAAKTASLELLDKRLDYVEGCIRYFPDIDTVSLPNYLLTEILGKVFESLGEIEDIFNELGWLFQSEAPKLANPFEWKCWPINRRAHSRGSYFVYFFVWKCKRFENFEDLLNALKKSSKAEKLLLDGNLLRTLQLAKKLFQKLTYMRKDLIAKLQDGVRDRNASDDDDNVISHGYHNVRSEGEDNNGSGSGSGSDDDNAGGSGGNNMKNGGEGDADGNGDKDKGGHNNGGGNMKGYKMDSMSEPGFSYRYGYHAGDENGYPVGQLKYARFVY